MQYAHITGWGMSVPHKVLTNDDISKMVDTSDEKIRELTGIRQRHIAAESDTASSLGVDAAFKALLVAGLLPTDLDLIICATSSPEHIFPATACLIQDKLGASNAGAFDLSAACSGFIYAMNMGAQSIRSGSVKTVLVIGTEVLSRFVDWTDRNTCILFGDGAGAFVLQASEKPGGVQGVVMHSDGAGGEFLSVPAGGSAHPASDITIHTGMHFIHMNGKEVFRFATRVMAQATQEATAKSGWKIEDLALIIPHQANARIIDAAARSLKLPIEKFMVNVDKYGNTSTASIPIATIEAIQSNRLKPGDKVVFVGFGAGLTWGALAAEWSGPLPSEHLLSAEWYKPWARVRSFFRRMRRIIDGSIFSRDR
ncbi:MAG: ketoacyl-ACP synthase III [Chloroflexi bacterium]|nr:ketoacyl-ACP synthase III [Chloroflexota bacterium]